MIKPKIGFIGGSGLYDMGDMKILEERNIETPWGSPSAPIIIAELEGVNISFLSRHGKGHTILPHEVNYRANIAALEMLGVEEIVAFSAVGSLKEEIHPLDFILPDQIIDRTKIRENTFFGDGVVGHVAFADPFCKRLQDIIEPEIKDLGVKVHTGETLICMEGPAFSTRAESNLYRSWGAGVINMSTNPEAKLAREAEICYAVVCMSTDYDCWKEDEEHVSLELVLQNLMANSDNAKNLIKKVTTKLGADRDCGCKEASQFAIITDPDMRSKKQIEKLKKILFSHF